VLREDTIVAISTPAGRGGLGVVRLSGDRARALAGAMLGGIELRPRHATWARYRDRDGALLDEVVATWFAAPHSATAEDVVEISAHGAPVLLEALLRDACERGARLAEPGEFTRRAFLHGRLDLSQSEAIGDLIAAHTLFQARTAARQMEGAVARLLRPLHLQLTELIARLEAGIDFADDDVSILPAAEVAAALDAARRQLAGLQSGFARGRCIREGMRLALLGRPNVGKSSLFNRLLQRDRAIVTPEPGTTRDVIEEEFSWEGIPVRLVDTAGIRTPQGQAEQLGIEKSWAAAADADLVLGVLDRSQPPTAADHDLLARLAAMPQALLVWNKSDLTRAAGWESGQDGFTVSALTGEGCAALRAGVRERILPTADHESDYITNARHAQQLALAAGELEQAAAAAGQIPHEVLLVNLYEALHALDAITGQTTVEDILEIIFSTFCIGK
jgi:tRNA modification GTPase